MTEDVFTYKSFRISDDHQTVSFDYIINHEGETHTLTETLVFPIALKDSPEQHSSLRALHLALGVSYYKIFVSEQIEQPYAMSDMEAAFWNNIWRNGLGEFLYVNKLAANKLAKFTAQDGLKYESAASDQVSNGALLGIGGGKDSIVAGELLKSCGVPVEGFVMATGEQLGQAQAVAEVMQVPLHIVNRSLDTQLLELQERPGAYKGHIPISLIFGLVGTTLAIAADKQYVVVANEASASIPRITGENGAVNHQWSKSFGFEAELQKFILANIAPAVTYFSPVRQLTSVGVAKVFAGLGQYFEVFTSDNFVFRIDPSKRPSTRWSLESPKSLSSFILLSAWIDESEMLRIFGLNFLDEASLTPLFLELVGIEGEPPLDCVGTVEELILSLNLMYQAGKFKDSHLTRLAAEHGVIVGKDWQPELDDSLQLQLEHAIPAELEHVIDTKLQERLSA